MTCRAVESFRRPRRGGDSARAALRRAGGVTVEAGAPGRAAGREVVERFLGRVSRSAARALLLDYDGTLAPFRTRRDDIRPYPGVADALRRLAASGRTRVAIISGRALEDLKATLAWLDPLPELWGSHGLERLSKRGLYATLESAPADRHFIDEVWGWTCAKGWERLLERKPFGLALHGRSVPPEKFALVRQAVFERWRLSGRETGLEAVEFDGGLEFRPAGRHKGLVVAQVLEEMGPEAAVAYLGDDETDEDAFRALRGRGLSVLVRETPRRTAADIWLRPPGELLRFLNAWERAAGDPEKAGRGQGTAG